MRITMLKDDFDYSRSKSRLPKGLPKDLYAGITYDAPNDWGRALVDDGKAEKAGKARGAAASAEDSAAESVVDRDEAESSAADEEPADSGGASLEDLRAQWEAANPGKKPAPRAGIPWFTRELQAQE